MAKATASWLQQGPAGEDTDVVRCAPDDGRYHASGADVTAHVHARRGLSNVAVPKARADGTSTGFDAQKADVVHVDPNMPDGGVVVDLRRLDAASLQAALNRSQYPHQVYYQLGTAPEDAPVAPATLPAGHPMASRPPGPQEAHLSQPLPPLPPLPNAWPPAPLPPPLPPPAQPPAPPSPFLQYPLAWPGLAGSPVAPPPQPTPAHDPGLVAAIQQMTAVVGQLGARVAAVEAQAAGHPPRRVAAPPPEPGERPIQVRASPDDPLAALKIPFIAGGGGPQPPRVQVVFELPGQGRTSAWFHAAVDGGPCLSLVYDTRHEGGQQWLPPVMQEDQVMVATVHGKTLRVASLGLGFALGALDVVVLPKVGVGDADAGGPPGASPFP